MTMVYGAQLKLKACANCGQVDELGGKFCSSCGSNQWQAPAMSGYGQAAVSHALAYAGQAVEAAAIGGTPTLVLPENMPGGTSAQIARSLTQLSDHSVPSFAHVRQVPPEVMHRNRVELAKMMVLLARERLFLLFHFAVFASVNIIGFVLALKCYNEFIGDEMSKIMMACTPFWIFNAVALTCLIPIKGTKRQIARLKEQIAHQKFKVDYGHLI